MTPGYQTYLKAVASLADQATTLSSHLERAASLGQADLDAAARKVSETDEESRKLTQGLSAADDALTRMTHDIGLELAPAAARQVNPGSLAEAERLLIDLQRELTAIERNCDWVRTHRAIRAQSVAQAAPAPVVAAATSAVTQNARPGSGPRSASKFAIGALAVVVLILIVVLVVILVVK